MAFFAGMFVLAVSAYSGQRVYAEDLTKAETAPDGPQTSPVTGAPEGGSPSGASAETGTKTPEDGARGALSAIPQIEPVFVKAVTEISTGHNDYNPVWSPSGTMLAFERNIGGKREINIVTRESAAVSRVYYKLSDGEGDAGFVLPGVKEEESYNSGLTWARTEDRFVFMSNAATGNYDIYVSELRGGAAVRLTDDAGKDGQADWSPSADLVVFVSGRSGKAELYLLDLLTKKTVRLTRGEKGYFNPQWSPDGRKIAMIYGSNENHDIMVIHDISRPFETTRQLTTWRYDDLRPVWSPDGKKIAFYTNYNALDDSRRWSIVVVDSDESGPTEGEALAAKVVAENVVPDMDRGPAWFPDGKRIAYVKNDGTQFNPIYIVDIESKAESVLNTNTKMNHDISCSADGVLAFRAQVEQWDHIYIAKPEDSDPLALRLRRR